MVICYLATSVLSNLHTSLSRKKTFRMKAWDICHGMVAMIIRYRKKSLSISKLFILEHSREATCTESAIES